MRDVAVVGAGPAGSIAARLLARRGHDVVMLEEHGNVGLPVHCTGLLGLDAFEEFDLPRNTILGRTSAARFWAADGSSVTVRSARVNAAVIDRAAFDGALTSQAVGAGAGLCAGWRVERIDVGAAGVAITRAGSSETIEARACVLACGANYRFHAGLGLGRPQAYLQSVQLETPFVENPHVEVSFGRETAPKGFAWLVPFRRGGEPYARMGLMCEADGRQRFDRFARALCDRVGFEPGRLPAPRFKMLPLAPVSKTFADRVVAVGDAAGLVKPTTGGGIYYGLLSGAMAADTLDGALARNRLGESALKGYEQAWRRRLGAEIRVARAFRHMAERLDDEAINSLIELARVNGIVPLLQETASFNWHRKAAVALMGHAAFRRIVLRSIYA
jgi:geranylgeranyl reductase family protein